MTDSTAPGIRSYRYLVVWIAIAIVASGVATALVRLFRLALSWSIGLLAAIPVHPVVIAAVAALFVGGVLYRISPDAAGEGVPSYLYYLNYGKVRFPLVPTVMKLPAAFLTISAGGAGGLIGPLGMVSSGLLARGARLVWRDETATDYVRAAAICGMSATVAALFHTPLAAGLFAVEIIQRANLRYRDLFPSLLTGSITVWLARALGWSPLIVVSSVFPVPELRLLPFAVLFSLLIALLSGGYVRAYALTVRMFRRDQGRVLPKVLIGMVTAVALTVFVNPALKGPATELTVALLSGDLTVLQSFGWTNIIALSVLFLIVRVLASLLTVGSGMSAGLAAPAMQIGILAAVATGTLLSPIAGPGVLPILMVVGVSGMLSGAMNVPVAAALLAVELFGLNYGIAGALASIVAFQLTRDSTIYDHAIAGSGRIDLQPGSAGNAAP